MDFIDFEQLLNLIYVALAMILGATIGFDRRTADKSAGLRTHMLVAGAAALPVSLGDVIIIHFDLDVSEGVRWSDPTPSVLSKQLSPG
jgi:putative Mg2+ transporter-C (MgtC) family protein